MGHWNGGAARHDPSFGVSSGLAMAGMMIMPGGGEAKGAAEGLEAINDIKSMASYLKQNFLGKSTSFAKGNQIRDINRLVSEYGGSAKDWNKMRNLIPHPDPEKFSAIEIHWYQNMKTGMQVEFKSKWSF